MAWGNSWVTPQSLSNLNIKQKDKTTIIYTATPEFPAIKFTGMVTVPVDKAGQITEDGKKILREALRKQGSNLVDDNQFLYFQCEGCATLFDPETKSFAQLQDKAHKANWKIKWNVNGQGYKIFCPQCVGISS